MPPFSFGAPRMARIKYVPNRVIDHNGISDGANVFVYQSGTTTPVQLYLDEALTEPVSNPYPVPTGAPVPVLYHDFAGNVRMRVVAADGSVPLDEDPYDTSVLASDLASPNGAAGVGYGANQTVEQKLKQRVSVLDYCTDTQREDILSNTGAVDVSGAWQAAFDALSPNGVLNTGGGTHLLSSAVSMTGKSRVRIIGEGARIIEWVPGTPALLTFTSCDRLWVEDMHFVGSEDYAYFSANSPSTRHHFIVINSSRGARVRDVTGEGKRGHIHFDQCSGSIAEYADFVGFFQNLSEGAQANANTCAAVLFSGGRSNKALHCYAENHGSCVQGLTDGIGHTAFDCGGRNLHDNGVYCSSGTRFRAIACDFEDVNAAGVKTRGSQNIAALNTAKNVGQVAVVTGNGTTPDSYGTNGIGNIAALNSGSRFTSDGIGCGGQDGYFQRNAIIALNALDAGASSGGFGAIRGAILEAGVVSLNSVTDVACDYGMFLAGSSGSEQKGLVMLGNTFGHMTGSQQAIRLNYVQEGVIGANAGSSIANLIQGRFVTNTAFPHNVNPLGSTAITLSSTYSNTDNVVVGTRGSAVLDNANNPAFGSFPNNNAPVNQAPKAIGLTTVIAGVGYISTGTTSAADWKQITT